LGGALLPHGEFMKAHSLFQYFFFGTSVRYLQDAGEAWRIHDSESGYRVLSNIAKFLEQLDELGLQVTSRAAKQLRHLYRELEQEEYDAVLTKEQARTLAQIMTDIRMTLEAELEGFYVYTVTPKRIDTTKLMSDISFLFAPNTYARLPEIARFDLDEAGKCIAFERPTAAAFHLMRAAEAVLRAFFKTHIETSSESMWGPMVKVLRTSLDSPDYGALLNNLDNIRLSFRNPTQHPQKIYDIQEAQDLWGLCVDVINRMARDFDEAPK
jgi:hypothetical protein